MEEFDVMMTVILSSLRKVVGASEVRDKDW